MNKPDQVGREGRYQYGVAQSKVKNKMVEETKPYLKDAHSKRTTSRRLSGAPVPHAHRRNFWGAILGSGGSFCENLPIFHTSLTDECHESQLVNFEGRNPGYFIYLSMGYGT